MKTLNNKTTILKNGTEIIDLLEPTYVPDYDSQNFIVHKFIKVTPEYEKRVDLISLLVYGSDQYSDIILKTNEISDPLSIKTGDVLVIPFLDGAKTFYVNPKKENPEVKQVYLDSSKKSKTDNNRLQTYAKISASTKNGSSVNTKPNELKPGETNIIIDKTTNSISF